MKQSILIIALSLISLMSYAQTKTDTLKTKAPARQNREYSADPNRVYDIHLELTMQQIQFYITAESELENSDKLTGAQITDIKDFRKDTNKDIIKQLNALAKADYDKWCADTAAVNNVKLKK